MPGFVLLDSCLRPFMVRSGLCESPGKNRSNPANPPIPALSIKLVYFRQSGTDDHAHFYSKLESSTFVHRLHERLTPPVPGRLWRRLVGPMDHMDKTVRQIF